MEVIRLYKAKGVIELCNDALIKKYPGIPGNGALESSGYTMPRYTMHMVKDSSIT
jgi:hypothetical protein